MMKKEIIAIAVAAVVLAGLIIVFGINSGESKVKFDKVSEKMVPREIEADIIPEYRDLERALACKVGDAVYVIVTRGEKPTSGYEAEVEKLSLESKDDKTKLIVYANFADPEHPENLPQVTSFPSAVVKADITGLPDTIELRAKYVE